MSLENKRVLITAGPTWVPIDKVRVISNIATGQTGILLAKKANKLGAKVTLVLGPAGSVPLEKAIAVRRFCYFDELHKIIKKELEEKKYDIVIHSAAVSDYKPKKIFSDKIKSEIKNFSLGLEATVKIVDKIKKYSPETILVIFKLELETTKSKMIKRARKTMLESNADLAVANTFDNKRYHAFIVDKENLFASCSSKVELCNELLKTISLKF